MVIHILPSPPLLCICEWMKLDLAKSECLSQKNVGALDSLMIVSNFFGNHFFTWLQQTVKHLDDVNKVRFFFRFRFLFLSVALTSLSFSVSVLFLSVSLTFFSFYFCFCFSSLLFSSLLDIIVTIAV